MGDSSYASVESYASAMMVDSEDEFCFPHEDTVSVCGDLQSIDYDLYEGDEDFLRSPSRDGKRRNRDRDDEEVGEDGGSVEAETPKRYTILSSVGYVDTTDDSGEDGHDSNRSVVRGDEGYRASAKVKSAVRLPDGAARRLVGGSGGSPPLRTAFASRERGRRPYKHDDRERRRRRYRDRTDRGSWYHDGPDPAVRSRLAAPPANTHRHSFIDSAASLAPSLATAEAVVSSSNRRRRDSRKRPLPGHPTSGPRPYGLTAPPYEDWPERKHAAVTACRDTLRRLGTELSSAVPDPEVALPQNLFRSGGRLASLATGAREAVLRGQPLLECLASADETLTRLKNHGGSEQPYPSAADPVLRTAGAVLDNLRVKLQPVLTCRHCGTRRSTDDMLRRAAQEDMTDPVSFTLVMLARLAAAVRRRALFLDDSYSPTRDHRFLAEVDAVGALETYRPGDCTVGVLEFLAAHVRGPCRSPTCAMYVASSVASIHAK